jgi:PRTRC genetic system protein B
MSFEISGAEAPSARLTGAILLYGASFHQASYATVHPVEQAGPSAPPVIRPGRPVTQEALRGLAAGLVQANRRRNGLLPPEVLAVGDRFVVWWAPPAARSVYFDCRDTAKSIGQRSGKAWHPGLVFAALDRSLRVYAVTGGGRPDETTRLYNAPYFNTYRDGAVCTGSMPLPDASVAESIAEWVRGFFGSNFSHTNHERTVRYRGGAHAFWKAMLDGKFAQFPEAVLVPCQAHKTVAALIAAMDAAERRDA